MLKCIGFLYLEKEVEIGRRRDGREREFQEKLEIVNCFFWRYGNGGGFSAQCSDLDFRLRHVLFINFYVFLSFCHTSYFIWEIKVFDLILGVAALYL